MSISIVLPLGGEGKGDAQLEKFAVQDSQKNSNRPQKELTINI